MWLKNLVKLEIVSQYCGRWFKWPEIQENCEKNVFSSDAQKQKSTKC